MDDFSNFFVDKIGKIRKNFQNSSEGEKCDTTSKTTACFTQFEVLSEYEVANLINKASSKSCSLDPIPTCLVNKCVPDLLPSITNIINMSLQGGVMPVLFKQAVVTSILKKEGADPVFKNFRPISNLPFLSKLIEKAVCRQLSKHTDS